MQQLHIGWDKQTFICAVLPNNTMNASQACYNLTHRNPVLKQTKVAVLERDAVVAAQRQLPN